jgi:hypothetical protein
MSNPSRLQIGILVTTATLIVCALGVRAELKAAKNSIAERRRLQTQPSPGAARSIGAKHEEQGPNPPPR